MHEWVQLFLKFVENMAWPTVTLVGILIFRKEFSSLMNRLIGVVGEFSRKVDDLKSLKLPGGIQIEYVKEQFPEITQIEDKPRGGVTKR